MLNKSEDGGHSYLTPDIDENAFISSLSMIFLWFGFLDSQFLCVY